MASLITLTAVLQSLPSADVNANPFTSLRLALEKEVDGVHSSNERTAVAVFLSLMGLTLGVDLVSLGMKFYRRQ